MFRKSRTDIEEPNFVIPNTENVEPMRTIDRIETELPMCSVSKIDNVDPNLVAP
jgi:hypothetical protein